VRRIGRQRCLGLIQRVESSRMKRMTPEDPGQGQAASLQEAIFPEGLKGIRRACGVETARRGQKRRKKSFVGVNYSDRQVSQFRY
jgi:hypothetical protein